MTPLVALLAAPSLLFSSAAIWQSNDDIPKSLANGIVAGNMRSENELHSGVNGGIGDGKVLSDENVSDGRGLGGGGIDNDVAISDQKTGEIDGLLRSVLNKWQIPGAELAIARNGKLLYACGYGYADLEARRQVYADSLFRIGSISKFITAVAVMKLSEEGKLKLSDKVFSLLPELVPEGKAVDQRVNDISIADLLDMTAGWDLQRRREPLFMPRLKRIACKLGTLTPPDLETICYFELSRRLEFDPGSYFSYSNLSYAILGRLVSRLSALSYEEYCRNLLFEPLSLRGIIPAGRLLKQRQANEVRYYPEKASKLKTSIFSQDLGEKLPAPYGQIDIERYCASFGWVSNAASILKFSDAVLRRGAGAGAKVLSQASTARMFSRPLAKSWQHSTNYVASACELTSDFSSGRATLFKDGTLTGTRAFLICYADGTSCCVLFNARPKYRRGDPFARSLRAILDRIDQSIVLSTPSTALPSAR